MHTASTLEQGPGFGLKPTDAAVKISLAATQLWCGQLSIWGGKCQQDGQEEVQTPKTCTSTVVCLTAVSRTCLIILRWLCLETHVSHLIWRWSNSIYICFHSALHALLLICTGKVVSKTEQTRKHDAVAFWYAETIVKRRYLTWTSKNRKGHSKHRASQNLVSFLKIAKECPKYIKKRVKSLPYFWSKSLPYPQHMNSTPGVALLSMPQL